MMPVSGVNTGAVQPLTAAGRVSGTSRVQNPEEEAQGRPLTPARDEYIQSEPQEPSGRYWVDRDEDGQPRVVFDDPAADTPEGPEKKSGEEEERWACDTGRVDREIEALKRRQQELRQRLNTESDEARRSALERQLSQVERELKQKDSDAYRRQHADFTRLS